MMCAVNHSTTSSPIDVADAAGSPRSATGEHVPPAARRTGRPGWRDPRLVVGVAVVAISVVLGARIFAAADDTVQVWAAARDLQPGTTLQAADLEPHRIRFTSTDDANRYLSAAATAPVGAVLARPVGSGELLPRAALGSGEREPWVEVPVAAATEAVPATVRAGSRVDVWVTPDRPTRARERSVLVLDDVRVVAAPAAGGTFGAGSTRQLVVGVPASDEDLLATALAQAAGGAVVVTRHGSDR
jgi:hypothetical protein